MVLSWQILIPNNYLSVIKRRKDAVVKESFENVADFCHFVTWLNYDTFYPYMCLPEQVWQEVGLILMMYMHDWCNQVW